MRNWTPEQRARQAEACRRHKPSRHATGPKTAGGKARSRMNALKHGRRTAETRAHLKMLHDALRAQRRYLAFVRLVIKLENARMKRYEMEKTTPLPPVPANEVIAQGHPTRSPCRHPGASRGPWKPSSG